MLKTSLEFAGAQCLNAWNILNLLLPLLEKMALFSWSMWIIQKGNCILKSLKKSPKLMTILDILLSHYSLKYYHLIFTISVSTGMKILSSSHQKEVEEMDKMNSVLTHLELQEKYQQTMKRKNIHLIKVYKKD